MKDKAKAYAKRHGYQVRRVTNSLAHPNGYVKVIAPDGAEHRAVDWAQAWQTMMGMDYAAAQRN